MNANLFIGGSGFIQRMLFLIDTTPLQPSTQFYEYHSDKEKYIIINNKQCAKS